MDTRADIIIIGGGVASLVAGIELHRKIPNAKITLYSAADEIMLGGQLASWDEEGYPIEHGLHALFGFYDHILPILKRVGAFENFTKSPKHTFIFEKEKLHKFAFPQWPVSYTGFSHKEKIQLTAFLPKLVELVAQARLHGLDSFDQYDHLDLREFGKRHGIPDSILNSHFFRQFYDGAFNHPYELSAAVGVESIYKIFSRPWHYYFNLPSRQALIEPLLKYFQDICHGKIVLNHKLTHVLVNQKMDVVEQLKMVCLKTKKDVSINVGGHQHLIMALGLEDFKAIDFGEANDLTYFKNIAQLKTVSSVALQAWFKNDPVPKDIDSLVGGLPEPLSILCPMTRVRPKSSRQNGHLPFEISATGPESGFENVPDQEIINQFLKTLKKCGFKIPKKKEHMHIKFRRNREPFHRYLLTLPGQLALRPEYQSPLQNLYLAGAWVRNSFGLPCVDAAAEGAIKVAELIANKHFMKTQEEFKFWGMPKSHPLAIQPPFCFPNSKGAFFIVDANEINLRAEIPTVLELVPGFQNKLCYAFFHHQDVYAENDSTQARYCYYEVVLLALVKPPRATLPGVFPIAVYVDDDTAMVAGREVYGFPKKMARFNFTWGNVEIERKGRRSMEDSANIDWLKIVEASWDIGDQKSTGLSLNELMESFAKWGMPYLSHLPFFNFRQFPLAQSSQKPNASLSEISKASPCNLEIKKINKIKNFSLQIGQSITDPLVNFAPENMTTLQAKTGIEIEFSFKLGSADIYRPA